MAILKMTAIVAILKLFKQWHVISNNVAFLQV